MEDYKNEEIELVELYRLVRSNIKLIVIVTLVALILGTTFTKVLIKPTYQSQAMIIVNNRKEGQENVTTDELNSARNLANVYSIILKSEAVSSEIVKNLELDLTSEVLSKKIAVQSVDNTQVMRIIVKDGSPQRAYEITNELVKLAPTTFAEMTEAGSVKVISGAQLNEKKISPNLKMNALVSLFLGLFGSIGFVFVRYMLDNTIKSETDIETLCDIPVLGVIPNFDAVGKGEK